ncbi:hypothetical protein, partial [Curtobacterium flaccumfaciens]|uniref:hypothetical protein n=1 Tax=Curtobacterium flaccumfaciens TaxID=2035 RepID=UPI0034262362
HFDDAEPRRHHREQDHELDQHFDVQLIQQTAGVLPVAAPPRASRPALVASTPSKRQNPANVRA